MTIEAATVMVSGLPMVADCTDARRSTDATQLRSVHAIAILPSMKCLLDHPLPLINDMAAPRLHRCSGISKFRLAPLAKFCRPRSAGNMFDNTVVTIDEVHTFATDSVCSMTAVDDDNIDWMAESSLQNKDAILLRSGSVTVIAILPSKKRLRRGCQSSRCQI